MKVNSFLVNLTSENPDAMKAFYADVVSLERESDMGDGEFKAAGAVLAIDGHSETKGGTKEPQRVLINFFVDDLKAEESRLRGQGVKFIRSAGKEYWGGSISTFLDPDGNYCQLIEYKPGA